MIVRRPTWLLSFRARFPHGYCLDNVFLFRERDGLSEQIVNFNPCIDEQEMSDVLRPIHVGSSYRVNFNLSRYEV